jgi:tetratricopeptide (TPR) repeat protein
LESIRQTPKEDFYYLNLGRSLMSLAEIQRSSGIADGEEREVDVEQLLRYQGIEEVAGFVQQETPMGLMSYARAVLKRAYDLNPMNKDHSANLARLHNFWFNWTQDPEKLRIATDWYEKANIVAPFDVALINESAGVHMMYSNLLSMLENQDESLSYQQKAEDLYKTSMYYDPLFSDADTRLAELYRQDGRIKEAGELYVQAIQRDPHQFDQQVETLAQVFEDYPDLLRAIRNTYEDKAAGEKSGNEDSRLYAIAGLLSVRLGDMERAADAYEQAVELDPDNVGNRKNYTIILSDTNQYNQALTQATVALSLTRQAEPPDEQEIQQLQYLIALLEESLARAESDTQ